MENQQPNTNPVPAKTPVLEKFERIKILLQPFLKDVWNKIYQNKKLFWLFAGILGFIVIIVIVGSIYKLSQKEPSNFQVIKTTPSPQSGFTNKQGKIIDDLTPEENKLYTIKDFLLNFDPWQKRLNPPEIDFKIDF